MVRKSVPLAQQVVNEILSGIEAGNLARDDGLLPSEAELSKRFDVSRATIREALSRLEQRGVVLYIRSYNAPFFIALGAVAGLSIGLAIRFAIDRFCGMG